MRDEYDFSKATAMKNPYTKRLNFLYSEENISKKSGQNKNRVIRCTTEKGADTMSFSIRLSDEEKSLADSYAKIHSISVGEAFKRALFEKIEDEYDIAIADTAYDEYVKSGKKSAPIEELWKECDI
jgi:predicted DNA-binding protein